MFKMHFEISKLILHFQIIQLSKRTWYVGLYSYFNGVFFVWFQTPPGVYCPGRTSLKKFPIDQMNLIAFKFRGEEYVTQNKAIKWSNVSLIMYVVRKDAVHLSQDE